jgi:glycosyltransferase involved in cell wall biosynthesis
MATYNGGRFIKEQIDSILCQLDNNDELIISDDESTDETINIINSYNDKRIKLLFHKKLEQNIDDKYSFFRLVTDNFENALRYARGDIIFLSDQDDIWLENRKYEMCKHLVQYDIVMCNFLTIDINNNIVCKKAYDKNPISKYFLLNVIYSRFLGSALAFNKKILEYVLPFPKGLFSHDYWIGCIGSVLGHFCFIEQPLHAYRRHDTNISFHKKSSNSIMFRIKYRLIFFLQAIDRIFKSKRKRDY